MLYLNRSEGEDIAIGDDIVIRVQTARDGRVRLRIEAPRDVPIGGPPAGPPPGRPTRRPRPAAEGGRS